MSGAFPIYKTYSDCLDECGSLVSYCAGTPPLIVCQLNVIVFLICIFLAVCTGVLIPASFCFVTLPVVALKQSDFVDLIAATTTR
ncbi:hypothetical protein KIN20_032116 [Parelaphostrongylus tenuis]|uniref:Uncharacterized protein n=1 Tax=Parelaphostrongylus tenuis TaxID=148309 RepID=A0AAD5WHI2_PARTN|nr:hypothetical protein KIN20_032116 [Parelaphostrongylus tenuis]